MGISKYWINIDEFIEVFKSELEPILFDRIKGSLQSPFLNCEKLLLEIEQLLPDSLYVKLVAKVKRIIELKYSGVPHIYGIREYVPPLKMDFDVTWKVPENSISLTGLQLETTGWKVEDSYSLKVKHYKRGIEDNIISVKTISLFKNVPFKEVGEHKTFRTPYNYFRDPKIRKGDEVIFTFHNKSGNSRQLYLDFEYLVGTAPDSIPAGHTIFFLDTTGSMWNQLQPGSNFANNLPHYLMEVGAEGDMIYTYFFGDSSDSTYEYKYCGGKTAAQTRTFFSNPNNITMYGGVGRPEVGLRVIYDKYPNHKNVQNLLIVTDCWDIPESIKNTWRTIREKDINVFVYIPKILIDTYKPLEDIDLIKIIGTF